MGLVERTWVQLPLGFCGKSGQEPHLLQTPNLSMLKSFIWYPICLQGFPCGSAAKEPTLILPYTLSLLLLRLWLDYLTIPSSATRFSCSQSFPASGSFPMSWLFTSCGQSIRASASASVFPMNIQGWFPLGLTGWISLQPKGLWRIFSNTTVQRHQFFAIQPFLWSNSCIHTWLLGRPYLWFSWPLLAKWCVCFLIHCLSWSYLSFQGTSIF